MRKMKREQFEKAKAWLYRNARPLEYAEWNYLFEEGTKETVMELLSFYQNEDGGFGHAMEADNRNPNSSPLTTSTAVEMIRRIDVTDPRHKVIKGILAYLESGQDMEEGKWPFSIPSNMEYPRAPWLSYDAAVNQFLGFNPTAVLAAFILHFAEKDSEICKKALHFGKQIIERVEIAAEMDFHETAACVFFAEEIKALRIEEQFDYDRFCSALSDRVNKAIETDTKKWAEYAPRPSMLHVSSPEQCFYPGNEEIVEAEINYLLDTQNDDGSWDISWQWGDYEKAFAVSENWWKGTGIITNINLLKQFGRIEF